MAARELTPSSGPGSWTMESDQFLVEKCFAFCTALEDRGCSYSFSLRLGQSFNFSLKSEKSAPPKPKPKRSPSYLRRQIRRRQDFLQKKSVPSPRNIDAVPRHNQPSQSEDADVENSCHSNLSPRPGGSVESGDYDAIQQWASDGIRDDCSLTEGVKVTSDNIGAGSNTPLNLCPKPVYPKKSEGSVDTDVMEEEIPRMIPDRSSWAKLLLSDHRHSIFTKYGEELVVFAPPGVPYSEIARAIKTPVDWRHMRPTSSKCTKWVYFPIGEDD